MQFGVTSVLFALAGSVAAAPWSMTSYQGLNCNQASVKGNWAVGPDTKSCINFAQVKSLRVNNPGPCTTVYYRAANCAGSPFAARQGICTGFNGQIVGSFRVTCSA